MTENKRFSVYGEEIVQGDECWAVAYSEYNADVIATALNELAEENKELKEQLKSEHQMLENAIILERTRMGKSALKQYKEAIM